jgi:arginase
VGSAVLDAVLPPHKDPTVTLPVSMSDDGLAECDGVEAKTVIVEQLARALEVIGEYDPARIVTSGECSVSVAPFCEIARRHEQDLAVIWIDSHPDIGTPPSRYPRYHAMAVAALTGHGDPAVLELLPAAVSPGRVALAGLHAWTEDDFPNVAEWGIQSFSPGELRDSTRPRLQ